MLFRAAILERIRSGDVTVAFRRWRKPTVKAGGTLRTSVGVLAVDGVGECILSDITQHDIRRAGFESKSALFESLDKARGGTLYRVRFHVAGSDPSHRIARQQHPDRRRGHAAFYLSLPKRTGSRQRSSPTRSVPRRMRSSATSASSRSPA